MDPVRQDFRDAMALLGAAVSVITSDGEGGRVGLTVSAVCSVTDDPPTVLACLNRGSNSAAAVIRNGRFCVNLLSAGQRDLSDAFAGRPRLEMEARFEGARWSVLATGAPALDGALASVDCAVEEVVEKGTHSVLFGAVRAIRLGPPGTALIWWSRDYRAIAGDGA